MKPVLLFRFSLTILIIYSACMDGCGQQAKKMEHSYQPLHTQLTQQQLKASLDTYVPQLLDSANIPGLSLAVVSGSKIVYVQSYGVRNVETKEKVEVNTVFDAASLSKAVFAYAVLKYVDEGLISLDKPLYQYLPYPDIERDDRYKLITARMVLSHSSGFPNWRGQDSLRIYFTPGEKYRYSGEGFVYLQKVIEKLTGKSINEFMTEKVFEPLEMKHSSYVWQQRFDQNFAISHDGFGNQSGKNKPERGNAAYSLQTTAGDYARFILAILNETGIKKATVDNMLTAQIPVPDEKNTASASSLAWGVGVGLQQTKEGKAFWHWGDNNTYKCYVVAYQKEKTGIVYFTNSYNGLGIARELIGKTIGGTHPALDYLDYDWYKSPMSLFIKNIYTKRVQKAIAPYLDANKKSTLSEDKMNEIGYQLLRLKKVPDALDVFKLNMEAYPKSANVYDSYAEACLANGEYTKAAQYYLKAFELNPDNKNAKHLADQLGASQKLTGNTVFKLKGHPTAKLVTVAGSFNQWNSLHTVLMKKGDEWVASIDLIPGKYQYKLIVDGEWILDPANSETAEENGYKNSLLIVK